MMDNCLSPSSETGGVGCDNMTMVVVALLRGKTKDEWYQEIADRVSKGDGPCAPPEFGIWNPPILNESSPADASTVAEMRDPSQRARNRLDDSGDDYDPDLDKPGSGFGGRSGRIILLGNGTEKILTDSGEQEVFEHEDDDRDLENQVNKHDMTAAKETDALRNQREDTPGPPSTSTQGTSESAETSNPFESPSSTTSEKSEPPEMAPTVKSIPESALPEKLVTPPTSKDK